MFGAHKLEEIQAIINKIDVSVRQVMIESRLVLAEDEFSKSLGARFGVQSATSPGSNLLSVGGTLSNGVSTGLATGTTTINGNTGLIPFYKVTDLTATYKFTKGLNLKAGVNNLFDERYFTRRAGGYPGPGALPADGRTFFISVGAKL